MRTFTLITIALGAFFLGAYFMDAQDENKIKTSRTDGYKEGFKIGYNKGKRDAEQKYDSIYLAGAQAGMNKGITVGAEFCIKRFKANIKGYHLEKDDN